MNYLKVCDENFLPLHLPPILRIPPLATGVNSGNLSASMPNRTLVAIEGAFRELKPEARVKLVNIFTVVAPEICVPIRVDLRLFQISLFRYLQGDCPAADAVFLRPLSMPRGEPVNLSLRFTASVHTQHFMTKLGNDDRLDLGKDTLGAATLREQRADFADLRAAADKEETSLIEFWPMGGPPTLITAALQIRNATNRATCL